MRESLDVQHFAPPYVDRVPILIGAGGELPAHFERLARRLTPEALPSEEERQAVVTMLLRGEEEAVEVLLMRRIEHPADPWSGQISLPGGHVDPEDENLFASALRETREEVQLDLARSGRWLCCLPTVSASRLGLPIPLAISPFVFLCIGDEHPSPGPEAQEVFWFPLGRAAAGELDAEHRVEFDGALRRMPGWRHEDRLVWGLTHRMLGTLLERLRAPS